ncbi:MAG: sodium:calcium antiporter [Thermoleophilia bacterium]
MGWLTPVLPTWVSIVAFVAAALAIGVFGFRLAGVVNRLADRTGMGEALAGAVLLGATTSAAGTVVSVVAAADGNASLAIGNSVGGIAVQTAFLVVADLVHRGANLEHAAASLTNVFNAVLVVFLLAIILMGVAAPGWTFLGIHPASAVIVAVYAYGLRVGRSIGIEPMWHPRRTSDTQPDEPAQHDPRESLSGLWARFLGLALVVVVAGWAIGRSGVSLIETTGISETLVGTFFTSVATSIPELVTTVAAVRAGALTLAVAGIVGGNTFDTLFVPAADLAYRQGSLYDAATRSDVFVLGWTIALAALVALGLVRRERGGIGFEGVAIAGLYAVGVVVVALLG